MSAHATRTGAEPSPVPPEMRRAARELSGYRWAWLIAGIAWVVISLVILQFNDASITTVGVLVGLMFALASAQTLAIATVPDSAAVPTGCSLGIRRIKPAVRDLGADLLHQPGRYFRRTGRRAWLPVPGRRDLVDGRAFLERAINPAWWLTLISGILMTILAFWTSGQLFIHKAYVLLVSAGIWALMEGAVDIVRAFEIRRIHEEL
jgi:uncharacterized membrane protein HdeD (DUF308 family)